MDVSFRIFGTISMEYSVVIRLLGSSAFAVIFTIGPSLLV